MKVKTGNFQLKHDVKIQSNQNNRKLDLLLSFVWYNSLQGEVWKEIKGYNGNYFVSNLSRVLSLCKNGYKLKEQQLYNSYYYVDLYKNGIRKHKRVNRLVAEAFLDNPENKPLVHHKDNQKQNNVAANLEFMTYKEHAEKHKKTQSDKI